MKWRAPRKAKVPVSITTHGSVTIVFENPSKLSVWVDVDGVVQELKSEQLLVVTGKNIYLDNKDNYEITGELTVMPSSS
jgi:hypothetical protein